MLGRSWTSGVSSLTGYNNLTNWPSPANRPTLSGNTLTWIGPIGGGVSTSSDPTQSLLLTTHSGDLQTTADNQVIQGLLITGSLFVLHNNVTIKQCAVVAQNDPLVYVPPMGTGVTFSGGAVSGGLTIGNTLLEDLYLSCEINGDHAIRMGQGICRRVYIAHTADGYELTPDGGAAWANGLLGGPTLAIDSYFEFLPSDFITGEHPDTIEADGGFNNAQIQHCWSNNVQGDNSSGTFSGFWAPINNLTLNNSRFTGGNYTLYYGQFSGNSAVTNVTITNNRISMGSFGYASLGTISGTRTVSGNVDDTTGANIDAFL